MKKIFMLSLISFSLYANSGMENCKDLKTKEERIECKKNKIEKKEDRFNKIRNVENKSHQGRINILTEADKCINSAKTKEAYKMCEQNEKASRQNLKGQMKQERQIIRN